MAPQSLPNLGLVMSEHRGGPLLRFHSTFGNYVISYNELDYVRVSPNVYARSQRIPLVILDLPLLALAKPNKAFDLICMMMCSNLLYLATLKFRTNINPAHWAGTPSYLVVTVPVSNVRICSCVCLYVCICVHVCTCVCVHTCVCESIYLSVHAWACVCCGVPPKVLTAGKAYTSAAARSNYLRLFAHHTLLANHD
jgi:hypothetical protein